ncbi:MAG TPA: hypothetical protein V6C71_02200 [Coleofasciculaceae cyanobacterium]|jgi:hypothetical protein
MSNKEHEKVYNESHDEDAFRTSNEGDVVDESKSLEEKKEQIAVESWDIAGHVKTPAYFVVEEPDGEEKALHHVKDAEEISDVIRQARTDEDGDRKWW